MTPAEDAILKLHSKTGSQLDSLSFFTRKAPAGTVPAKDPQRGKQPDHLLPGGNTFPDIVTVVVANGSDLCQTVPNHSQWVLREKATNKQVQISAISSEFEVSGTIQCVAGAFETSAFFFSN